MTCHFTYSPELNKQEILQGDLLGRNQPLDNLLAEIHPYYHDKEVFKYFIVLTQSCDLVRRNSSPCKARYITLAAVLPFKKVFDWEMSLYQNSEVQKLGGVIDLKKRGHATEFVAKILNNNHPEFFYLHSDDQFGLKEPHCAILRLSVAIRSEEHYEKCLDAKFLQLNDNFRAKLGWSVGQIFSRVGTKDWTPKPKTKSEFNLMIKDILDESYIWLDNKEIESLENALRDIHPLSKQDIKKTAAEIKNLPKIRAKDAVINTIRDILQNSNALNEDVNIDKLLRKIESDPVVSAYLRS